MICQLFATVPCQRFVEFTWQLLRRLDQRSDNALRVLVCDFHQHHVPRMPFNKGRDITVLRSANQVTLPVSWHGTIFDRCRSFADGHSILNLTISFALLARVLGTPDCAFGAQVRQKFFLQDATYLYIKASVNSLV